MFTAIIVCTDPGGSGEVFTLSREIATDDKATIYAYMKKEAHATDDSIDQILLVRNGKGKQGAPEVVSMWRAAEGDFTFAKTYTFDEMWQKLTDDGVDDQTDNQGQIVIYTGFYQWRDGSIRREQDPNWEE